MKVLITSSMRFKEKFLETAEQLRELGVEVTVPNYTNNDHTKRQHIDEHLARLKDCDALLVTNYIDDSDYGYIGASGFIEAGWAFALGKKIFMLNPVSPQSPYAEDLEAVVDTVINGDLHTLIESA